MSDAIKGAGGGGILGIGNFLGDVQSNKNSRALDATMAKWSPWLKGTATSQMVTPKTASLLNSVMGGANQGADFAQKNPDFMKMFSGGGLDTKTIGGTGGTTGGAGGFAGLQDGVAAEALAAKGGVIPGKAPIPGNSPWNDIKPVMASSGEGIVPRTMMGAPNKNKSKIAAFLNESKKHPGQGMSPKSNTMSPWAAMASCGGVVK